MKRLIATLVAALLCAAPAFADSTGTNKVKFTISTASPTTCTVLAQNPLSYRYMLETIVDTSATLSVYPQFWDDNKCTIPANSIYGDSSTIVLGAGQIYTFNQPLNTAFSYTLSGALSTGQNIIVTLSRITP